MTLRWNRLPAVLLLVLAAGCGGSGGTSVPSSPVSAGNLSGLLGMSYSPAVDQVRALGYDRVSTRGATSYWSDARTGRCARLGRSRGRVTSVTMLPSAECNR